MNTTTRNRHNVNTLISLATARLLSPCQADALTHYTVAILAIACNRAGTMLTTYWALYCAWYISTSAETKTYNNGDDATPEAGQAPDHIIAREALAVAIPVALLTYTPNVVERTVEAQPSLNWLVERSKRLAKRPVLTMASAAQNTATYPIVRPVTFKIGIIDASHEPIMIGTNVYNSDDTNDDELTRNELADAQYAGDCDADDIIMAIERELDLLEMSQIDGEHDALDIIDRIEAELDAKFGPM